MVGNTYGLFHVFHLLHVIGLIRAENVARTDVSCCRSISWYDASRRCEAKGEKLLQESHDYFKYVSFTIHALEYERRTGNFSVHVLLLQFPKIYQVGYSKCFVFLKA